jgi:hypothetical protein
VRARGSRMIDRDAIADASLERLGPIVHDDGDAFIRWAVDEVGDGVRHVLTDSSKDQAVYPILWIESAGMAASLRIGLGRLGWPLEGWTTGRSESVKATHDATEAAVERCGDARASRP